MSVAIKDYQDFLLSKSFTAKPCGFDIDKSALSNHLFPFQADLVRWALAKGRAALFTGCGSGKTLMQLEWAHRIFEHARLNILILAPLAVSHQTIREGQKFGIDVNLCESQSDVKPGINITNYEKLHKFDLSKFGGIVLDESSILKSYSGAIRNEIIQSCSDMPYRLACTATPAPNDFMELGNHSEFLGVMSRTEMLATFFVHDGGETSKWRLKGHAEDVFWKWVCGWAAVLNQPSDLGYSDEGFRLPALKTHRHVIKLNEADAHAAGLLFVPDAMTLQDQRIARRSSMDRRVALCAELVNSNSEPWAVWCDLNDEGDAVERAIPNSINVQGSDADEYKTDAMLWFVGDKCICSNPKFSAKLATWRRLKDHQDIGSDTTLSTETNGSLNHSNTSKSTETIGSITCENITAKTNPISGGNEPLNSAQLSTLPEERNTPKTRNGAKATRRKLSNGNLIIPKNDSPNDSDTTASLLTNIEQSLSVKAEAVLFADSPIPQTKSCSHSSTTATTLELCAESSVPPVISESANSKTIPNFSIGPRCICGHESGKRILISKSKICGFGLNFQHCSNVAFVGVNHSFESMYQTIRRCWRFGQKREVNVHIILAENEQAILSNLERKEHEAERMMAAMLEHMKDIQKMEINQQTRQRDTRASHGKVTLPAWIM